MMETIIASADILIPRDCDMTKWSVVACDQFSSQPEYWEELEKMIGNAPSTLHMILPEAYLTRKNPQKEAKAIREAMRQYLSEELFLELPDSFLYLERKLPGGDVRKGLIGAVDLEAYSCEHNADSPIRATEDTVPERLPPRIEVRRSAPLEMPHIMVFLDDERKIVLDSLAAKKESFPRVYDFELNGGGGHITGWQITGYARETLKRDLADYENETMSRYPGEKPVCYAAGDGNHSLAAAKEYWEEEKKTGLTEEEFRKHPARFCLVELVNIHDNAVTFEPIHKVLFGTEAAAFFEEAAVFWQKAGDAVGRGKAIRLITAAGEKTITVRGMTIGQLIGEAESFCLNYCKAHGGTVDYIHNDETAINLGSRPDGAAVLLPRMEKAELFPSIIRSGPLPRKSFSIGHATEKRYYLECRKIK